MSWLACNRTGLLSLSALTRTARTVSNTTGKREPDYRCTHATQGSHESGKLGKAPSSPHLGLNWAHSEGGDSSSSLCISNIFRL